MPDTTPAKRKSDPVQSAMHALEKMTQEERIRVLKAASALWGIAV